MTIRLSRRCLVKSASASLLLAGVPALRAEEAQRHFDPQPQGWRTFDVTTTVTLKEAKGPSTIWLPVPSLDNGWQRTLDVHWTDNAGKVQLSTDGDTGAKILTATYDDAVAQPSITLVTRVQTQNRAVDWKAKQAEAVDAAELRRWVQPSELIPVDGIVRKVAQQIVAGTRTDREKVQRIYDWVIVSSYRDPKVRGCGVGDIRAMLESGNLSGKCADINALFVGLCRAAGIPARDIYGIRLVPSAFGYRELGGNPASLQGAQHCRSEVYLKGHGWVAMDPADVTKVMRQETPSGSRTRPTPSSPRCAAPCSAAGKATGWATAAPPTSPCPAPRRASWPSSCTRRPRRPKAPATPTRRTPSSTRSPPRRSPPERAARRDGEPGPSCHAPGPRPGALLAAGLAALLASGCCVAPLALALLGVSGAWIGQLRVLEPWSPWLLGGALTALGLAAWQIYRRPAPGDATCAADDPACGQTRRGLRRWFWVVALLTAVPLLLPLVAPWFY
jgi:transglutaminase-like putative cysteine protease